MREFPVNLEGYTGLQCRFLGNGQRQGWQKNLFISAIGMTGKRI